MPEDDAITAVKTLGVVMRARARPPEPRKPHLANSRPFFPGAVNVLAAQALGYLCLLPSGAKKTTVMAPTAVGGLGAFAGLVSLPCILFRAVATLDFSTVDPTVVLALFVGKLLLLLCSYALGVITSDASTPGLQMLTSGCFALLNTNSDDLGLGLPVRMGPHP